MTKKNAILFAAIAGLVAPTAVLAAPPEPTTITKTTVTHNNHQVMRKTVTRHTTCRWVVRHHHKVKVCR